MSSTADELLTRFIAANPHVGHAIAVSGDGLLIAASASMPRDQADRLAAVAAGLAGVVAGAAGIHGIGAVRQHIVETDGTYLFLVAFDYGALAAIVAPDADMGHVGYAMTLLVEQVGGALRPDRRTR